MLGQLAGSFMMICFAAYQATTTAADNLFQFVICMYYLSYTMFELYVYCRWCDELSVQRSYKYVEGFLGRNKILDGEGSDWWRENGKVGYRNSNSLDGTQQWKPLLTSLFCESVVPHQSSRPIFVVQPDCPKRGCTTVDLAIQFGVT
ncbi:hypothetical protein EVAR_92438_1 [Eumeta japonica]|uniref:Uncharacterized protein n=1 Tax=Eumeta variegata TaxID=151549 RepID=A0A4C1T8R9_EUMVA|nr:hypothetical protein EVAR_92438_1 [Eumeta japonica]